MSRVYYPLGHFPTAAVHGAPNRNSFLPSFPVALSLADAVNWYWAVSRWRATFTVDSLSVTHQNTTLPASVTASGLSVSGDFVPAYYADEGAGTLTPVTDEKQLCLPCSLMAAGTPAIAGSGSATEVAYAGQSPVTTPLDFSQSNISLSVTLPGQYANGLFYPIVQFNATIVGNDPAGSMSFQLTTNNQGIIYSSQMATSGTLLGKPFPLTTSVYGFVNFTTVSTQISGASLSVTAADYWPYAD